MYSAMDNTTLEMTCNAAPIDQCFQYLMVFVTNLRLSSYLALPSNPERISAPVLHSVLLLELLRFVMLVLKDYLFSSWNNEHPSAD